MRATLYEWTEFLRSNIYLDMMEQIEERKNVIVPLLVAGSDPEWTDDNMRGRLNELEFVATMPKDIVAMMELELQSEQKEESGPSSFMGDIFNNFKKGDK